MPLLLFPDASGDAGLAAALRRWLITGAALTIPFVITVVVLGLVLNVISQALQPVVTGVDLLLRSYAPPDVAIMVSTVATAVGVMLLVGLVAERAPTGGRISATVNGFMEAIPGVGSVYGSFRRMSEVVIEDAESFQDVKLVEYPTAGSYTVAFVTADTPARVHSAAGHDDMVTLFMPMAPNPVMGGFVLHVDRDRVIDIDMTVEEGIQSIVTSGVTVGDRTHPDLDPGELRRLGAGGETPELDATGDRREEYEDHVDEDSAHPSAGDRAE